MDETREERRSRLLWGVGRLILAVIKGVVFVLAVLFAAVFGCAFKQNPPRR